MLQQHSGQIIKSIQIKYLQEWKGCYNNFFKNVQNVCRDCLIAQSCQCVMHENVKIQCLQTDFLIAIILIILDSYCQECGVY